MASGLANDRDPPSNGRSRTLREWLKLADLCLPAIGGARPSIDSPSLDLAPPLYDSFQKYYGHSCSRPIGTRSAFSRIAPCWTWGCLSHRYVTKGMICVATPGGEPQCCFGRYCHPFASRSQPLSNL
jgi:hypothetical protein